MIGLGRTELELGDQSVHLVDHQQRSKPIDPSLSEHRYRLSTDSFPDINKDKSPIAQSRRARDLGCEIDMTRSVDDIA